MKRPKMPVLTSPWKIGFFVSLMLVVVSSGVSYYFIRKSEFSGTMPRWTGWNSIVESVTPPNGAVIEFWPLLAVVGLSALFSYVLITRAVRQYKGFLDSGHDYRNLLSTIRDIRDLENQKNIEALRNHPELRNFLISIREMAAVRKKELDLREEALDTRADNGDGDVEREFRDRLSVECGRLVDAIGAIGGNGFPRSVDLAFPELQEVERALRTSAGDGGALDGTGGVSVEGLSVIAAELEAGIETGREIEIHLNQVAAETPKIDTATIRQEVEGLSAALQDLTQFATRVGELDEEAKAVAINSALKAGSGQGTQSDLIELADEVKDIAAGFGNLSGSWSVLGEAVTGHIQAIEAELSRVLDSMNVQTEAGETVANAAQKVSRCVEHLVTVLEKVNGAAETPPENQPAMTSTPAAETPTNDRDFDTNEYGFETIERVRPLFSTDNADASEDVFEKQPDEVLPEASTTDFAEFSSAATDNEIVDGFEHDESIVMDDEPVAKHDAPATRGEDSMTQDEDSMTQDEDSMTQDEDSMTQDEDSMTQDEDSMTQDEDSMTQDEDSMTQDEDSMTQDEEPVTYDDDPISGSGIDVSGIDLEGNSVDLPPAGKPVPVGAAVGVEDDAIDLYELGAVDYEPMLHG